MRNQKISPDAKAVLERLEQVRAELQTTTAELVGAEAAMDARRAADARARCAELRGFVATAERDAAAAQEVLAAAAAAAWLQTQTARLGAALAAVSQAQAQARAAVAAAVAAIAAEGHARAQVEDLRLAAEVLHARFPDVTGPNGRPLPPVPPLTDHAQPVLAATDALLPRRGRRLVVNRIASDTPAEGRQKRLHAAVDFVARHGDALPAEVRAMLAQAGTPALDPVPERSAPPGPVDPVLAQAVAELAALPPGMSAARPIHRG